MKKLLMLLLTTTFVFSAHAGKFGKVFGGACNGASGGHSDTFGNSLGSAGNPKKSLGFLKHIKEQTSSLQADANGDGCGHANQDDIEMVKGWGNGVGQGGEGIAAAAPGPKKIINICGEALEVPIFFYFACLGSSSLVPEGCTFGTATTAGTSCYAALTTMSITCGVSIARMIEIGRACIAKDEAEGGNR
mgnify:CR=1 FL=1